MKSFGDIKVGSFWKLKEEFRGMLWNSAEPVETQSGAFEYPTEKIDDDIYELVKISTEDVSDQRYTLAQFRGIYFEHIFGWDITNVTDYLVNLGNNRTNVETLYKL